MGACGLLFFAMVLPDQANHIAQQVLGETTTVNSLIGVAAPVKTISQAFSSAISKGTNQLIGLKQTGTDDGSSTTPKDTSPLSMENIIDATNAQRVKAGLSPLKTNAKLAASAKIKVEDMIANHYFEHTSPTGKTVADLGNQVGYDYVVMGENLALGNFTDANDLLQAWMNSPGHRANILNTSYQDIGVYAAEGTYQDRTVWFAVQHFGTERGVCPSISTTLKTSISALNIKIKKEETDITALRTQIENPNHVQGDAYSNLISQFNALVSQYNANVTTSQQQIAQYDKQVVAFNKCLSTYQVSKEG